MEYGPQPGLVRQMEVDGGGGIEIGDVPQRGEPAFTGEPDERAILNDMAGALC
jgi:hypothetical protein